MLILFFKSADSSGCDSDRESLPDKIRRILQSHVDEAKTDEERERAERELVKFSQRSDSQKTKSILQTA
jgi:hypothetical protein